MLRGFRPSYSGQRRTDFESKVGGIYNHSFHIIECNILKTHISAYLKIRSRKL
jgi:hypothetical protein